jgi:hypothetical protein
VPIVGGGTHTEVLDEWIDVWHHEGRLAWDGDQSYAAYHGRTRMGVSGQQQGDKLGLFTLDGSPTDGGWPWGCSKSLDVRLSYRNDTPIPICLSDHDPEPGGIVFNNSLVISEEPGAGGYSDASLGGLVVTINGFCVTYASVEDREDVPDAAFSCVALPAGDVGDKVWLSETPQTEERGLHLARYEAGFLAAWIADGEYVFSPLAADGTPSGAQSVDLGVEFNERDDFVNLPGGDVAWAYTWDDPSTLKIVRITSCP